MTPDEIVKLFKAERPMNLEANDLLVAATMIEQLQADCRKWKKAAEDSGDFSCMMDAIQRAWTERTDLINQLEILEDRNRLQHAKVVELEETIASQTHHFICRGEEIQKLLDKIEIQEQRIEYWMEYTKGLEDLLAKWQAERGGFLTEQEILKAQVRNRNKSLADLRSERDALRADKGLRVPVNPTEEMLKAGIEELLDRNHIIWEGTHVIRIYRAMIKTAPKDKPA